MILKINSDYISTHIINGLVIVILEKCFVIYKAEQNFKASYSD
jgi:hypothetical protein